ncbi:MAG: hypothetical protein ACT4P7_02900 [Gemmatimonadaceae bacterium]
MESAILSWLEAVGSTAFRWSAVAFLVVNGVAIAAVILTRDRALVNRWTGRLLAANLTLAGTGLGIPLLTSVSRLAVSAFLPGSTSIVPTIAPEDAPRRDARTAELIARD